MLNNATFKIITVFNVKDWHNSQFVPIDHKVNNIYHIHQKASKNVVLLWYNFRKRNMNSQDFTYIHTCTTFSEIVQNNASKSLHIFDQNSLPCPGYAQKSIMLLSQKGPTNQRIRKLIVISYYYKHYACMKASNDQNAKPAKNVFRLPHQSSNLTP